VLVDSGATPLSASTTVDGSRRHDRLGLEHGGRAAIRVVKLPGAKSGNTSGSVCS